ncbi:MAG: LysM peptidoglycan-binding domain-containing protein [Acidobacteria bacterium]|nr:MAG: LysM peptidoglycan-binding domain-containing protein [Acidobacteriota bacterium]REK03660.1 MAG: LysM peptidoglycan-binding domain-containing protein [Acidobacteriota bacterium]
MAHASRTDLRSLSGTVPFLLAAFAITALATSGSFAQQPPKDLRLVGDHWTAWDPPTDFPEGAQVHIIERGDTLWDLAQRFLGNAYLWPQLWEPNRYILDAHWIYPGDPLLVAIEVAPAEALEELPTDITSTEAGGSEAAALGEDDDWFRVSGRIAQLGTADDIYCSGYIGPADEPFDLFVSGSEYDVQLPVLRRRGQVVRERSRHDAVKRLLNTGDIVYLSEGRDAGLSPGDLFTAVRDLGPVFHPDGGEVFGHFYDYLARLRVLSVQETSAIAEVRQSCKPLEIGATLKPFEPEPIPSERRTPLRPVNQPVAADQLAGAPQIIYAKDRVVTIGQDHVVFLDQGEDQGVFPGDIFTVYRPSLNNHPPVVIGEVAVLSVQPGSATAKILESRYPVFLGDLLDLK